MDVDPKEGVMLRLDYITYADTLDCLVYFFLFPSTMYDMIWRPLLSYPVRYDLKASCVLLCTISISEPRILRYLVLGEFRSLST